MINGMTGFGSAQINTGKLKISVEIKSVNHRYFDLSSYLPPGFGSLENKIRQMIQKSITRGKVTLSIKMMQFTSQNYQINKDVVKQYLSAARQLKKEFGISDGLSTFELIKLPGVVESKEKNINVEALWSDIEKNIEKAMLGLTKMRQREGRSLAADVKNLLLKMLSHVKKIEKRSEMIIKGKKKELTDDELKSFLKGMDVSEEVSRLKHYIGEMSSLLKSAVSIGKKMDFIAQEMQRETNTIGSKLQDKIVSNSVIALKSKIEKIREQSQNIE
ncbi:MAG: YicC family protein [Candidatus Omnitrophica bacterium]|nr:YicC family protein [Candidatus Omnitrophota bacterium]MCB9747102.1 YicC family protein [Candidatus Omnitrophota bacterium]